jgi:hypothetical protein
MNKRGVHLNPGHFNRLLLNQVQYQKGYEKQYSDCLLLMDGNSYLNHALNIIYPQIGRLLCLTYFSVV